MPNDNHAVAEFRPSRIAYHPALHAKFGVDKGQWNVLVDSIWPSAKSADAIVLALSYCKARSLDPFKRPVHIVPMWNSALGQEVETVWPGISEIRTTATRTGQYAGCDAAVFGETRTKTFEAKTRKGEAVAATVSYPAWCQVTVYRVIGALRVAFVGPKVHFEETFSQAKGVNVPNARWCRSPSQMLEKCAEAAALRKAFPEELGNTYAAEEMEGRDQSPRDVTPAKAALSDEPPIEAESAPQGAAPEGAPAAPKSPPPADHPRTAAQPANAAAPVPPQDRDVAAGTPAPDNAPRAATTGSPEARYCYVAADGTVRDFAGADDLAGHWARTLEACKRVGDVTAIQTRNLAVLAELTEADDRAARDIEAMIAERKGQLGRQRGA